MLVATFFIFGKSTSTPSTSVSENKKQELIRLAKERFNTRKSQGVNMENGPCLGIIATGWVVDIVHNPREPIDDKPENQCSAYKNGSASHFIELDPDGNLIKVN